VPPGLFTGEPLASSSHTGFPSTMWSTIFSLTRLRNWCHGVSGSVCKLAPYSTSNSADAINARCP
jgi:hypothetical protein